MSVTSSLQDELLVLCCQDGDADAIHLLVKRWQPRLWRHARMLTGADDAAWDVVQESWLAIVNGLHKLLDASQFRVWAYRIVTHKSTDWIRKQVRDRRAVTDFVADGGAEQLTEQNAASPAEPTERSERRQALQQALSRLGTEHRAVLTLYYLEEMNIAEIAAALAIPAGTVKSRLFHARNELKHVWLANEPATMPEGG